MTTRVDVCVFQKQDRHLAVLRLSKPKATIFSFTSEVDLEESSEIAKLRKQVIEQARQKGILELTCLF